MSTTNIGRKAESAAKIYLEMRGFEIIEQNWRRPQVEIDIVATKDSVIHFVEVKYRYDNEQGGGFEAITQSKLRRMRRGAASWVAEEKYRGEYTLSAVEIGGDSFTVMGFIEDVL